MMFKLLLKKLSAPYYRRFLESLNNPRGAQDKILKKIIHELSKSMYGRDRLIKPGMSYQDYQKLIPLVSYDDIGELIKPTMEQKTSPLLSSFVVSYEITSGSSGSNKIIPYTKEALASFRKMAAIWVHDTLRSNPKLKSLKIFYAISPPKSSNIGFNDDEEYLGALSIISRKFSVVPKHVTKVKDFFHFRFCLSLHLLSALSLEIIYIWSPSYWLSLLEFITDNKQALSKALEQGFYELDGRRHDLSNHAVPWLSKDTIDWPMIWPNLKIISCWTDAQAHGFCEQLKELFPNVKIQPKGLLATEAAMTITVDHVKAPVPFLDEVFFEFIEHKGVHRIDELTEGQSYELVISNLSGLYRYRTYDMVKVVGFHGRTPMLRFMGRANKTSDMVGEKISESFVTAMLESFSLKGLSILVPNVKDRKYVLLTSDHRCSSKLDENKIDKHLSQNCHYRYARKLEQLKEPKLIFTPNFALSYERYHLGKGLKWGDIKISSLISNPSDALGLLTSVMGDKQ